MGRKKRDLWYEDDRYSTNMGDRIYLHADNFIDWIDLAESYHDAVLATLHSFYRDPEGKVSPISVTGFLYRHAIELTLKAIVIVGKRSEGVQEEFLQSHNLDALWKDSLDAMKKMYRYDTKSSSLNQIEGWITMLELWDKDATRFRYPSLINGKDKLPDLHKLIWTCERTYKRLMLCFCDMWNRYAQQD
jgi:hypothetical protein